jgi:hypothetical protein
MNKVKIEIKDNKFDYYGYKVELTKTTPTNWAYTVEGYNLSDNASGFRTRKEAIEAARNQVIDDLHDYGVCE